MQSPFRYSGRYHPETCLVGALSLRCQPGRLHTGKGIGLNGFDKAEARALSLLLLFSIAASAIVFLSFPIGLFPDSETYVGLGEAISAATPSEHFYRTPFYPLLLQVFQMKTGGDATYILVTQYLMGLLIPILLYFSIRHYSRRRALLLSLLIIGSFTPFLFAKSILTEQLYIFLICSSILIYSRILYTKKPALLYLLLLSLGLMGLTRPVASLLWFPVILLLAFQFPAWWKHLIASSVCLLALYMSWSIYRAEIVVPEADGGSYTNLSAWALFLNVYHSSAIGRSKGIISPQNGHYSSELETIITEYLRENIAEVLEEQREVDNRYYGARLYVPYEGNHTALARAIFETPDRSYFWLVFQIVNQRLPIAGADHLIAQVVWETLRADPMIGLRYFLRNLRAFTTGNTVWYPYGQWNPENPSAKTYVAPRPSWVETKSFKVRIFEKYRSEALKTLPLWLINPSSVSAITTSTIVEHWSNYWLPKIVLLGFCGSIISASLLIIRRDQQRFLSLFCLGIALYSALVTSLFVEVYPRFVIPIIPALAVATFLLPARFRLKFRREPLRSLTVSLQIPYSPRSLRAGGKAPSSSTNIPG